MIWSFEIQTLGRLLCAERTSAHQALYGAGRDAIFQRDAAECAAQCLLADEPMPAAVIEQAVRTLEEML